MLPPAHIVDFSGLWVPDKTINRPHQIFSMNIIPNLLPLITVNLVRLVFFFTARHIRQKPMELRSCVRLPSNAAAAECASSQAKVMGVFLYVQLASEF